MVLIPFGNLVCRVIVSGLRNAVLSVGALWAYSSVRMDCRERWEVWPDVGLPLLGGSSCVDAILTVELKCLCSVKNLPPWRLRREWLACAAVPNAFSCHMTYNWHQSLLLFPHGSYPIDTLNGAPSASPTFIAAPHFNSVFLSVLDSYCLCQLSSGDSVTSCFSELL